MYRSVNACLRPLASIDGMAVTTIEGIGNSRDGLHPLQDRLAKGNGSQCGYCSPGFVMTAYAYLREHEQPTERGLEDAFAGNLCRCTGYRPILEAMRTFATAPPAGGIAADTFPDELRHRRAAPLRFAGRGLTWYRPTTLAAAQALKRRCYRGPHDPKLVAGNTSIGIYKADAPRVLIDIAGIAELQRIAAGDDRVEIGGAVTYTRIIEFLTAAAPEPGTGQAALLALLAEVAGTQVRDEATVGGAVSLVWQHADGPDPFPSDLYTALVGLGATVTLASDDYDGGRRTFGALELPAAADWPHDAVVASVLVPAGEGGEHVETHRVARREQNAHALVNACLSVVFGEDGSVRSARLAFGAIAGLPVRATRAEQALVGRRWDGDALSAALEALHDDLGGAIVDWHDGISRRYRLELAASLFYRFFLSVAEAVDPSGVGPRIAGGAAATPRPLSTGVDDIPPANALPKITASRQTSGEEVYVTDIGAPPHTLHGALVWSIHAHADFAYRGGVDDVVPALQERFRGVVAFVTAADMPGSYGGIGGDDPVLVTGTATAYGQLMGLVVAEDERVALAAAAFVQEELVAWSPRAAVLGIAAARDGASVLPNSWPAGWLNYQPSFTRVPDDRWVAHPEGVPPGAVGVATGVQRSGMQAHFYMECNAVIAQPTGDGAIVVDASTQSPDSVQGAVMKVLGLRQNQVRVRVRSLGGGFGGKTTRSPFVAAPVALAAWKLNAPVRLAIDRNVDMAIIGKRHAFECDYHAAYDEHGRVVAMTTALASDGGNTIDCSFFVIHVAQLHADNCYLIPSFGTSGMVYRTNVASNISMRAFGVVQTILAQEDAIEHVGYRTGRAPEDIREELLYENGDRTHYGEELTDCTIRANWERLMRDSDFAGRAEAVKEFNAANRWKKRGIAMIPLKYGAQYEVPALNYAGSLVSVFAGDGSVVVQCGGIEMGQGLQTKVTQICARALGIAVDLVTVADTDTSVTVNATSTGADSGADLNGWATYIAARQLRARLELYAWSKTDGKGDHPYRDKPWEQIWPALVGDAHGDRVDLAAYAFYKTEGVTPDQPYSFYTWSVGCSEVEVDVLTGQVTVLRSDLLVDAGVPLNPLLDLGQAQGAFVQGLGMMFTEEILFDGGGRLTTDGTWEYKPPCSHTIPVDFRVSLKVSDRQATSLPIEHAVALMSGAGPAAFRPDVAVLALHAMHAHASDPPAVPAGSTAELDPAVVADLAKVQVYDSDAIAADDALRADVEDATAAALHSAKTVGEPPVALAASAFLATKRAILAARADAGVEGWFELDAPATVARVRDACATPREQMRL